MPLDPPPHAPVSPKAGKHRRHRSHTQSGVHLALLSGVQSFLAIVSLGLFFLFSNILSGPPDQKEHIILIQISDLRAPDVSAAPLPPGRPDTPELPLSSPLSSEDTGRRISLSSMTDRQALIDVIDRIDGIGPARILTKDDFHRILNDSSNDNPSYDGPSDDGRPNNPSNNNPSYDGRPDNPSNNNPSYDGRPDNPSNDTPSDNGPSYNGPSNNPPNDNPSDDGRPNPIDATKDEDGTVPFVVRARVVEDGYSIPDLDDALRDYLGSDWHILIDDDRQWQNDLETALFWGRSLLLGFILAILIATTLSINAAVSAVIAGKHREIAILYILGATDRTILRRFRAGIRRALVFGCVAALGPSMGILFALTRFVDAALFGGAYHAFALLSVEHYLLAGAMIFVFIIIGERVCAGNIHRHLATMGE